LSTHVPKLNASSVAKAITTSNRSECVGSVTRLRCHWNPWLFSSRNNCSVQTRLAYRRHSRKLAG
jgi:hypothetical protein